MISFMTAGSKWLATSYGVYFESQLSFIKTRVVIQGILAEATGNLLRKDGTRIWSFITYNGDSGLVIWDG